MTTQGSITVDVQLPHTFGQRTQKVRLGYGVTTLLGPNGSGKTQTLLALRTLLPQHIGGRKVRYISPARLASIEAYRSDVHGDRGGSPLFGATTPLGASHQVTGRHSSSGLVGDALTLSERPDVRIKVESRLADLFRRQVDLRWTANGLSMTFTTTDAGATSYQPSQEASGLLHLISILSAAFDDEVGALLIDEPEVSLHPQLQAYVLRELQSVAGDPHSRGQKLVAISTHSPFMLDIRRPPQLASVVFCQSRTAGTIQLSPESPELGSRSLSSLLSRMGDTHRSALFADKVLLVEGPSDQIIAQALVSKLGLHLDAAGTQIVPVIGKGEIIAAMKLFGLAGKQCFVIVDLDAFIDDGNIIATFSRQPAAQIEASSLGHESLSSFASAVRGSLERAADSNFDDLSSIASRHRYLAKQADETPGGRARVRAVTASLLTMSKVEVEGLPNAEMWAKLRTRADSLFDTLETVGCFVLRRGTIEDYFTSAQTDVPTTSKPNLANDEADAILEADELQVRSRFGEIVRALEQASRATQVNENARVRTLLLSILAPCLDSCTPTTTNHTLMQLAKSLAHDRSSLFGLENLTKQEGIPTIRVSMRTAILDGTAFPIEVTKSNMYAVVAKALR